MSGRVGRVGRVGRSVADSLFRPHPEQRARASREPKLAIFEERGGKLAEEWVMKLSHWTRQLPKVKGRKRKNLYTLN